MGVWSQEHWACWVAGMVGDPRQESAGWELVRGSLTCRGQGPHADLSSRRPPGALAVLTFQVALLGAGERERTRHQPATEKRPRPPCRWWKKPEQQDWAFTVINTPEK